MTMCACGQPLHYTDPRVEELVSEAIARHGESMVVIGQHGCYLVQRHYLALHGLKGSEIEDLAHRGIIRWAHDATLGTEVYLAKDGITKGA